MVHPRITRLATLPYDPGIDVHQGDKIQEPIGGPSPWRDHLDKHGPSIHSVSFNVKGMQEHIDYLVKKGGKLVSSRVGTGGKLGFAFVDLPPPLDLTIALEGANTR